MRRFLERQQLVEQLYSSSISTDYTPLSLHQASAYPLPSLHDILGLNTNIDPALRSLGPQAIAGPIVASCYAILPQRIGPT